MIARWVARLYLLIILALAYGLTWCGDQVLRLYGKWHGIEEDL